MPPLLFSMTSCLLLSIAGVNARAIYTDIASLPTTDISSSIFANSGNCTASGQRCGDIDNCRTLDDIVQSCLVTILACVWFAVHRNIPAPEVKRPRNANFFVRFAKWVWRTVLDRRQAVIVFVVALLVPEWILFWALRQALCARKLRRKLEAAREEALVKYRRRHPVADAICDKCKGRGSPCDLVAAAKRVGKADECMYQIIQTNVIDCILTITQAGRRHTLFLSLWAVSTSTPKIIQYTRYLLQMSSNWYGAGTSSHPQRARSRTKAKAIGCPRDSPYSRHCGS